MEPLCNNSDITPSFVRYDDEEEDETPSWASSEIQLSSASGTPSVACVQYQLGLGG